MELVSTAGPIMVAALFSLSVSGWEKGRAAELLVPRPLKTSVKVSFVAKVFDCFSVRLHSLLIFWGGEEVVTQVLF